MPLFVLSRKGIEVVSALGLTHRGTLGNVIRIVA